MNFSASDIFFSTALTEMFILSAISLYVSHSSRLSIKASRWRGGKLSTSWLIYSSRLLVSIAEDVSAELYSADNSSALLTASRLRDLYVLKVRLRVMINSRPLRDLSSSRLSLISQILRKTCCVRSSCSA